MFFFPFLFLSLLPSSLNRKHFTYFGKLAELALECYASRGVPIDIITDLALEHGATVDIQGYNKLKELKAKEAKGSWVGSGDTLVPPQLVAWADKGIFPEFIGICLLILIFFLWVSHVNLRVFIFKKLSFGSLVFFFFLFFFWHGRVFDG